MPKKIKRFTLLLCTVLIITGCSDDDSFSWQSGPETGGTPIGSGNSYTITDYRLPAGEAAVTLSNLAHGERVVVIPLNPQPVTKGDALLQQVFRLKADYRGGPVPAVRSGHNPLVSLPVAPFPLKQKTTPGVTQRTLRKVPARTKRSYNVGESAVFRVPVDFDDDSKGYTDATAKLLYKGEHCYIYFSDGLVAHSNAGWIATNAGKAFDTKTYPRLTARFGYEYGGGPDGDGGVDHDKRVTILYENVTANPPGGYHSGKDHWDKENSNLREMFYICHRNDWLDVGFARHATIAHEFQHLIEYNRIYLANGTTAYQMSFFNEGLSQVAEGYAGFGPDTRMSYLQADPQLSYGFWGMENKPIIYSYGAAFAVASYMVRRFGEDFITALLDAPITSIENVSNALYNTGYTNGYQGIVLDTLTAHYLDRDQYRYPPAYLYPGDTGIPTRGSYAGWYGYPSPTTNNWMLPGIRTRLHREYPVEITGELYQYGADLYEFISGNNGTLQLLFNRIQPDIKLRIIRFKPYDSGVPRIDGQLDDWQNLPATTLNDPADDHNMTGKSNTITSFAAPCSDILQTGGLITNNRLYFYIKTATADGLKDKNNEFLIKLDLSGDGTTEYNFYLYQTRAYFLRYTNDEWVQPQLDTTGIQYARGEAVELRLPLSIFSDTFKSPIGVQAFGYTSGDPTIYDWPDGELWLTLP